MTRPVLAAALIALMASALMLAPGPAGAAGDLSAQAPIVVIVKLGDDKNASRFFPDALRFETGKLYQLKLVNPGTVAHYFVSEKLAAAVYTRKVQVNGPDGKPLAEVKGNVREIEVYPGATAEWWFVPVKTGSFSDLRCTIAGHAEAGMVGKIVIE